MLSINSICNPCRCIKISPQIPPHYHILRQYSSRTYTSGSRSRGTPHHTPPTSRHCFSVSLRTNTSQTRAADNNKKHCHLPRRALNTHTRKTHLSVRGRRIRNRADSHPHHPRIRLDAHVGLVDARQQRLTSRRHCCTRASTRSHRRLTPRSQRLTPVAPSLGCSCTAVVINGAIRGASKDGMSWEGGRERSLGRYI